MTKIKIFVFNPFQENTFLIHDETNECVVIDAGCNDEREFKELDNYINDNNLTLKCYKYTRCALY